MAEKMTAAYWCGPKKLELRETSVPAVTEGTLLVKVHCCCICGSDVRIYSHGNERIQAPRIIGHELSGEIVEVGRGVKGFSPGDRISIGADIPCGECVYCKRGVPNCCTTNYAIGYQFDGGFAQYILLPALLVDKGPLRKIKNPATSYATASLAEPLACCLNGYELGLASPGKTVAVFGAGPIGVMLGLLAPVYRAEKLIVIDPNAERLKNAAALLPGAVTLNPSERPLREAVMELTAGLGADLIFTACPVLEAQRQALQIVAKRGVINFFGGLPKTAEPLPLSTNFVHYNEIYITGSHGSTPRQHAEALDLLESGKIPSKPLITGDYPLARIGEAFDHALSQRGLKIAVRPSERND